MNYGTFKAQDLKKVKEEEKGKEETEQIEDKGAAQQIEVPKGKTVKASALDALAKQNMGAGNS